MGGSNQHKQNHNSNNLLQSIYVYISWTTRHFMHRIFCFHVWRWNTLQTAVQIEVIPLGVRCAFLRYAVTREQAHTKASSDWGVAEGEESCFVQKVRFEWSWATTARGTPDSQAQCMQVKLHILMTLTILSSLLSSTQNSNEVIISSPPSYKESQNQLFIKYWVE